MKAKNLAFQLREAYWHSKARLLVEWLLKRLGIMVEAVAEKTVESAFMVWAFLPVMIVITLLYWVMTLIDGGW